jgi:hypothetical protein
MGTISEVDHQAPSKSGRKGQKPEERVPFNMALLPKTSPYVKQGLLPADEVKRLQVRGKHLDSSRRRKAASWFIENGPLFLGALGAVFAAHFFLTTAALPLYFSVPISAIAGVGILGATLISSVILKDRLNRERRDIRDRLSRHELSQTMLNDQLSTQRKHQRRLAGSLKTRVDMRKEAAEHLTKSIEKNVVTLPVDFGPELTLSIQQAIKLYNAELTSPSSVAPRSREKAKGSVMRYARQYLRYRPL